MRAGLGDNALLLKEIVRAGLGDNAYFTSVSVGPPNASG